MRAAPAAAIALVLLVPALHAGAPAAGVSDYFVGGAHGRLAVPVGAPLGLVVIAHGYAHQAVDHDAHLQRLADEGYVAVAMDFGPASAFPLRAGADQTEAATRDLLATYGFDHAILYSVSMGTAVAGMVLADMPGVFTYWVDNEGLAMLHETWAGATALSPSGNPTAVTAKAAIEEECGGTPATAETAYLERSAAVRAPEFVGLKGVILLHDTNDGLVPTNQGREMEAALAAVGIPTDDYQVLRGEPGHEGTSLTGYAGVQVDGMAGHGNESDDTQAMTALSFHLLDALVTGRYGVPEGHREYVVDRDLGTLP
ncbi:MAG: hypothetical protein QOE90_2446 [Thermoplasmata archaeon]|jgi:hypothetical protein|nr:hypothetical protein [Thermoplasmata archaeon]